MGPQERLFFFPSLDFLHSCGSSFFLLLSGKKLGEGYEYLNVHGRGVGWVEGTVWG